MVTLVNEVQYVSGVQLKAERYCIVFGISNLPQQRKLGKEGTQKPEEWDLRKSSVYKG